MASSNNLFDSFIQRNILIVFSFSLLFPLLIYLIKALFRNLLLLFQIIVFIYIFDLVDSNYFLYNLGLCLLLINNILARLLVLLKSILISSMEFLALELLLIDDILKRNLLLNNLLILNYSRLVKFLFIFLLSVELLVGMPIRNLLETWNLGMLNVILLSLVYYGRFWLNKNCLSILNHCFLLLDLRLV